MDAPTHESEPQQPEFVRRPLEVSSVALTVLAVLAVFYTLELAAPLFVPITVALLLHFLLMPAVRRLRRLGLPPPAGAGLVLLVLFALLALALVRLSAPAGKWLEQLPHTLGEARELERHYMEQVSSTAKQVDALTSFDDDEPALAVRQAEKGGGFAANAQALAGSALLTLALLYFLLASYDTISSGIVGVFLGERRRAIEVARAIERDVSRYLVVITVINAVLGVTVAAAMWLLGMPNPLLWGVMATLFNFVPYAGAAVGTGVLALVAISEFESPGRVLLVPAIYFLLTCCEGMLVTPAVLGQRLRVRPAAVFVWMILWAWLWGVAGALVAVPLLVAFKILCNHVPSMRPLAEFLARAGPSPSDAADTGSEPREVGAPGGAGKGAIDAP